jgi:hypothetical protein
MQSWLGLALSLRPNIPTLSQMLVWQAKLGFAHFIVDILGFIRLLSVLDLYAYITDNYL